MGLEFIFVRATDAQMKKYWDEAGAWHGGSSIEGETIETGIKDTDADEPSRVRSKK